MPLKMKNHFKIKCHSKWNVTQNRFYLKMEFPSKWTVPKSAISIKIKCHSKWNETQNELSHKMKYNSK